MEPVNPYIVVHSGEQFDLIAPTPDMVDLDDIARALARQPRWNGHTRSVYSVAQHSVQVSHIVEDLTEGDSKAALAGLFHDAHEAYIGDIVTPVKKALIHLGCLEEAFVSIKSRIDKAIFHKIGIPDYLSSGVKEIIREADHLAAATEFKLMMPNSMPYCADYTDVVLPRRVEAAPLKESAAQDYFIDRHVNLVRRIRSAQEAA